MIERPGINKIIRTKREELRLEQLYVASQIGLTESWYNDIENKPSEFYHNVPPRAVFRLLQLLELDTDELFGCSTGSVVTLESLQTKLKEVLRSKKRSLEEIEEAAGFYLTPFLENKNSASSWTIDCLEAVCSAVGVNWCDVLPAFED